jgi:hypothetical protein
MQHKEYDRKGSDIKKNKKTMVMSLEGLGAKTD